MAYRTPRFKLHLRPQVLRSIVDESGMDHAAIAQKLGVDKPRVDGWISTGVIEYSKVRALAKCTKMSENVFLTTIPLERKDLPDYRMMGGAPESIGADDRPAVRRARYMQSAAKEMMDDLGIAAGPDIPAGIGTAMPADRVALKERGRLAPEGPLDGPLKGSARAVYGGLRRAVEGLNILAFQYPLSTDGVRGLSLTGSDPCAVLINSRETDHARSFTLLHEYGHILLRKGGICDEHGASPASSAKKRVEAWCNRFAASFLMPEEGFVAERRRLEKISSDHLHIVGELAAVFRVSRYAAAVRAADLAECGSKAAYGGVLDRTAGRYSRGREMADGGTEKKGGPQYIDVLVSRVGKKFARLAIASHERGVITSLDLGNYLDMDLKHLDNLSRRVAVAG